MEPIKNNASGASNHEDEWKNTYGDKNRTGEGDLVNRHAV
jgi:hypothetical protein